ncbi:hypothetical protein [Phenylobacterium sp.]|uniref:hypothetical protein n=1 Tax=Phenylobacterium sp. TaxID=1871053 RepID=UPI003568AFDE
MTTTITAEMFSGRPNPTWLLTEAEEAQLNERLAGLRTVTQQRSSGAFGGLGYRGMAISRAPNHPHGPLDLRIHEAIVEQGPNSPNLVDDAEIEQWLAGLGRSHIPEAAQAHFAAALRREPDLAFKPPHVIGKCPACHAVDAPAYNPGLWNVPNVQPYNNCYNYANNQITNTFAQPGRATGHPAASMACKPVEAGAVSDGLIPSANFTAPLAADHGWYVALVIWPNADYHWYRQDKVGCWSHKPGQTAVRNVDNAGHAITDPKTCDRGPYTVFCTYMITKKGVHIR